MKSSAAASETGKTVLDPSTSIEPDNPPASSAAGEHDIARPVAAMTAHAMTR
jgi:hypothetical protein